MATRAARVDNAAISLIAKIEKQPAAVARFNR
jgi:hypothetical protein